MGSSFVARWAACLSLGWVIASCSPTSVCVRNSDCPAGNYCSGGACVQDCTPTIPCSSGAACSSFGMCVAAPDSAVPDAAVMRPDAGSDAFDPRAACVVAGGTDADGDGYCAAGAMADCDETSAATHPGATEVCTPSTVGSTPHDENCDGAIDESCSWHFGRPHVVEAAYLPASSGFNAVNGTFVSRDGQRIYANYGSKIYLLSRAARTEELGAPAPVAFADASLVLAELDLADDELTGVIGGRATTDMSYDLYAIARTAVTMPFTATRIAELSDLTQNDYHPTLSRDGLEIFFRRAGVLMRSTRPSITTPFAAPVAVPGFPAVEFPSLTSDDRDLVFASAPTSRRTTIYIAHRSDPTAAFGAPVEQVALNPMGDQELNHPRISLATRELFFTSSTLLTGGYSRVLYRAQICRDGPCSEAFVDCPAPGRRSDDGFHCYTPVTPAGPWGNARGACAMASPPANQHRHLASIQSEQERILIFTAFGASSASPLWVGGNDQMVEGTFVWDTAAVDGDPNEAWFAHNQAFPWGQCCPAIQQPDGNTAAEDCMALDSRMVSIATLTGSGFANDADCGGSYTGICELHLWPTW